MHWDYVSRFGVFPLGSSPRCRSAGRAIHAVNQSSCAHKFKWYRGRGARTQTRHSKWRCSRLLSRFTESLAIAILHSRSNGPRRGAIAERSALALLRWEACGVDRGRQPADPRMRPHMVVQRGLRTPTGLFFARLCVPKTLSELGERRIG